jgi:putative membrane protein insertion efficiency factor
VVMNPVRLVDRWLALPWRGLIFVYRRLVSPVLPGACRFEPTCSCYADEALARWGFFRGFGLAVWRILRCQPLSKGGWDPVPSPRSSAPRRSLRRSPPALGRRGIRRLVATPRPPHHLPIVAQTTRHHEEMT